MLALRQARLKLLIAYSTIAQIGYLFLIFPLASGAHPWSGDGWSGGMMQTLSHAFAKAAMFLAAGLVAESLGHDRIAGLRRRRPGDADDFFALGFGGLSLMGLPPSGGFAAKWLLLRPPSRRPMAVGGGDAGGRVARRGLRLSRSGAGARLTPRAEGAARAQPRGDRSGAGDFRCGAGVRAHSFFDLLQIGRPVAAAASR